MLDWNIDIVHVAYPSMKIYKDLVLEIFKDSITSSSIEWKYNASSSAESKLKNADSRNNKLLYTVIIF